MIRGALNNPYLVLIGVLTALLVGGIAIARIPSDILPLFQSPAVQVLTLYPGMPAEVMEKVNTVDVNENEYAVASFEQEVGRRSQIGISRHSVTALGALEC